MKIKNWIYTPILLMGLIFISGCEERLSVEEWLGRTESYLLEVERQSDVTPYRNEQFLAFKSYFKEINVLAVALKDDPKMVKKLNRALKNTDLRKICSQMLLGINRWKHIVKKCTKNNFFLCSEEVRAYPDAVAALRDSLTSDQKGLFFQAESCRKSFEQ